MKIKAVPGWQPRVDAVVAKSIRSTMILEDVWKMTPRNTESPKISASTFHLRRHYHKASAEAAGNGALFATAPAKGTLAHVEPDDVLHTYVELRKSEDWVGSIDFSDPVAAAASVAKEFNGWAPELIALITDGETAPVSRPIYALPVEHRWARVSGVTLLGDAAHVMAPSGEGANLAMYDGAELAKAIATNPHDLEAALLANETNLFPRSAREAAEADRMHEVLFGNNSPQSLLEFFAGHQTREFQ